MHIVIDIYINKMATLKDVGGRKDARVVPMDKVASVQWSSDVRYLVTGRA